MGNCSIGSRKLPIYCVDLSKKTNLDTSKKYVSISFDAAWGDEDTIKILDILDKYNIKTTFFHDRRLGRQLPLIRFLKSITAVMTSAITARTIKK